MHGLNGTMKKKWKKPTYCANPSTNIHVFASKEADINGTVTLQPPHVPT